MLLIELDYLDLVESRLNGFRIKYSTHLRKHNEYIILDFVKLITSYYYKTEDINSEAFKRKADSLLSTNRKDTDVFTISFYAWMKAKIDKADVYKTCLNSFKTF